MNEKISNHPEEFILSRQDAAQLVGERTRRRREALNSIVEKFYRGVEDTYKNLRLGFVQGNYEQVISRASIFFYLQFEAYVGEQWGEDASLFWSHSVFHGIFEDMKEQNALGTMPITDSQAKERKMRRILDDSQIDEALKVIMMQKIRLEKPKKTWTATENYHHLFYGHNRYGYPNWVIQNYNCALSRWLFGGTDRFVRLFGIALAENTELAIATILDDITNGNSEGWEEPDIDEDMIAGEVYGTIKAQMKLADGKLIMAGERTIFNIPQFGV
jgi:hypothetical protein